MQKDCSLVLMFVNTGKNGAVLLNVYVQPRGAKNCLVGLYENFVKVSVVAPPVDGKANKAVGVFLAKQLNLAKKQVQIHSGLHSRKKKFLVQGVSEEELRNRVLEKIEEQ